MTVEEESFEYLRSVNPIAQKIAGDIENVKRKHSDSWSSLEVKVKDKLLNDTLINLDLVKKYECRCDHDFEENVGPLSNFSWFTRSQLNLFSHINVKTEKSRTPLKKTDILSPLKKTKIVPFPSKGAEVSGSKIIKIKVVKDEKPVDKNSLKGVAKPKTPPPPPPSKLVPAERKGLLDDDSPGDDIPKTGFDFLDNW